MPPVPVDVEAALAPLRENHRSAALLLDLDGTLAPIVPRPEDAQMLPGTRDVVAALAEQYALVAFISGRGLSDLERIAAVPGVAYAGNHGMEVRDSSGRRDVVAEVKPFLSDIAEFAALVAPGLAEHDIGLEDKGVTLSLHTRVSADPDAADVYLNEQVAPLARERGLVPTPGRRVLEIRPPVTVNKGTASRELLATTEARSAAYFGDDRTDADAWRALRALAETGALDASVAVAAVSDEVPAEVRSAADVCVDGPAGALAALRYLDVS
jgi:trehalose 6-phosphate phosphatase